VHLDRQDADDPFKINTVGVVSLDRNTKTGIIEVDTIDKEETAKEEAGKNDTEGSENEVIIEKQTTKKSKRKKFKTKSEATKIQQKLQVLNNESESSGDDEEPKPRKIKSKLCFFKRTRYQHIT